MISPDVMSRRLRFSILFADLLWVFVSCTLAYMLRYGFAATYSATSLYFDYVLVGLFAMAVWTFLFVRIGLDGFSGGWDAPRAVSQVVTGVLLLMSVMLAAAFLARQFYSRLLLSYFGALLLAGFSLIRFVMRAYVSTRSRNRAPQRVVIVGSGKVARELADKIARHPELMKTVVGFLYSENDLPFGSPRADMPAAATLPTNAVGVINLLQHEAVDEIVVAHPRASTSEIHNLLRLGSTAGLRVSLVPEGYELYLSKASFLDIEGLPVLSLEEKRPRPWELAAKRAVDLILASVLTLLVAPVMLATAVALLFLGIRPFKRELRCGLQGRPFLMWRVNIDRHDPKLSGLRLALARFSLTELPQLLNVIAGDMSLVGPRPESPERAKHYSDWQKKRLNAKPGLTGLAQVHGLRDQHSSEDKARFDLQYLLHWSPLLDLSLLVQTLWTVGARLWRPARANVVLPQQNPVATFSEVLDVDRSHAGAD